MTQRTKVSIHALRVECDGGDAIGLGAAKQVSIHALRVECDTVVNCTTLSPKSFNPRTPCGVRPPKPFTIPFFYLVSIHALRVECDALASTLRPATVSFNPRTPCGVRLHFGNKSMGRKRFNPRTPCGVRPKLTKQSDGISRFQSTHSVWSATPLLLGSTLRRNVSIHALRVECDKHAPLPQPALAVSIHALRVECDFMEELVDLGLVRFQSTHSVWSATENSHRMADRERFQSTHSVWSATL